MLTVLSSTNKFTVRVDYVKGVTHARSCCCVVFLLLLDSYPVDPVGIIHLYVRLSHARLKGFEFTLGLCRRLIKSVIICLMMLL